MFGFEYLIITVTKLLRVMSDLRYCTLSKVQCLVMFCVVIKTNIFDLPFECSCCGIICCRCVMNGLFCRSRIDSRVVQ